MPTLNNISPLVPVSNMNASVDFFVSVLGFEAVKQHETHTQLKRDDVTINLIMAGPNKDLTHENSQMHCYINVSDIDELYASMEPKLSQLPEGRVRAPFNTQYGQREFHVIDCDALLLSFGESIASE